MNDGVDWLRVLNAVLAAVALVTSVAQAHRKRNEMGPELRFAFLSLHALIIVALFGTLESLYQDVPFGLRTVGVTIALVWVIVGSAWGKLRQVRDRWGNRRESQ